MSSNNRYPRLVEQFFEAKDAYNIVLGAMLGGYLALTISKNGILAGTYWQLGGCLIASCFFVLEVNSVGDRFHRRLPMSAVIHSMVAAFSAIAAVSLSKALGVDPNILITIFTVWGIMICFENMTGLAALFKSNSND